MKRKIIVLTLTIIAVCTLLTSTTYSLFYSKRKLANTESYKTGNLNIIVENNEAGLGNSLSLINVLPMSDANGANSTPYRFKISNVGNLDCTLDLELTSSGTINPNYIRIKVDNNSPITLGSNTTIATGITLTVGQSKTIELRVWLDENTPNSEIGKTFNASLNATNKSASDLTAADKIIVLSQGETYTAGNGNGVYQTNNHEYRYVGGEVNNYVRFNNDLYRIIGVFDDNSHGVTGQNLVKLISAKKLTAASWGPYNASPAYTTYSNYTNDWTGTTTGVPASANILLNEFYLNPTATSTYGECIDWTYGSNDNTSKSKNCTNIKGYGIQSNELRNYIQPVTWYLYGYTGNGLSKQNWYNCERNNYSGCTSAKSGTYSGTTTASIGLMYVSDYMYASGYVASTATTTGSSYSFMNLNWLYNGYEWTITPRGNNAISAYDVNASGNVDNYSTYSSFGLRPTFYLKSNIRITSGDGSFANPYIIG